MAPGRADVEHSFDYTMTDRQKPARRATHSYNTGLPDRGRRRPRERGRSPFVDIDEGSSTLAAPRAPRSWPNTCRTSTTPPTPTASARRRRASYDLDDRSQRQQWAADRLEQRDLSDATVYNGSDSYPTTEEETWTDGDLD
jgi:hypothetical protein